jgi:hypothetical protein
LGRDEQLGVGSIHHLEQKLESSVPLFQDLAKAGTKMRVFVPKVGLERLNADWLIRWQADSGLSEDLLPIVLIETAYELIEPLGLTSISRLADSDDVGLRAVVAAGSAKENVKPESCFVPGVLLPR